MNRNGYDDAETHEEVCRLVAKRELDASVWLDLDSSFPLERIAEAFDAVRRREMVKALVRLHE